MRILDPGHRYSILSFDGACEQYIQFMKRVGPKFPGNEEAYPGTNCQELLRVLIDRVKYLENQVPCVENKLILSSLENALFLFEARAARRHGRDFKEETPSQVAQLGYCSICGHVLCEHEL